jgi:hypothetical protein
MQRLKRSSIYLAGIGILGLACGVLEGNIANPALFSGGIVYLVLLRLFAEKFGK